jgi:serine/threonine-protein kinase
MHRQLDERTGTRTRMFVVLILGVIFTGAPLLGTVAAGPAGFTHHSDFVLWSIGLLLFVLGLGYWARDSMSKTVINRRVLASTVFLFVGQLALWLGAWELGVDFGTTMALTIFLWFVMIGMVAITVDRRIAPSLPVYLLGFVIAARFPSKTLYVMSAINLFFTINAAWAWKPEQLRWSEEERRAARAARQRPS